MENLRSGAFLAAAETETEQSLSRVEDAINNVFQPLTDWASTIIFFRVPLPGFEVPFVVLWLIFWSVAITIYLGFIQVRGLKTAAEVIRGRYSHKDDPGEITHFQALSSALSGTVGLGNIAGVAVAVTIGGPGATFWMILAGLFGMASKFAECTLGVKYRNVHEDGSVSGGAFQYLPIAFKPFGSLPAKILTGIFAIAILFFGGAGGNMFQANQTYTIVRDTIGGEDGFLGGPGASLMFGLLLAFGVAIVIIGGVRSIGRVTSKLVPGMGILYLLSCAIVIAVNINHVPAAFAAIIDGAFNPTGVAGGVLGVLIIGFQRAAFSNEAGLGSAPIAHSAVKTRRPVSEGFVALWEPFVDTVIICTFTALTIIIAQPQLWLDLRSGIEAGEDVGIGGVQVTAAAFDTFMPGWSIFLMIAVALFAYSTLITWAYYGEKAWHYLFGRSKAGTTVYRVLFCMFTVAGAVLTLEAVLDFADSFLFVCAFVNLLGVAMLLPKIREEMKLYLQDRKEGKLAYLGTGERSTDADVAAREDGIDH
ncbi:MAG: alanine/glycine:cation symporter family protein [Mobilicoccus sp.]|nr:alanine/glycine:cation symporter family protein [Mobilicoccus sp.]